MKILLVDNGQGFDLNTPYEEPLGGSETSLLLLAKGLSELGNSVVILTSNKIDPKQDGPLLIAPNFLFDNFAIESDIILLNRFIPQTIGQYVGIRPLFYYSHDAYDQPLIQWLCDKNLVSFFTKIFCVSEWQRETFIKYFNVNEEKLSVLPNPLDLSLYFGYTERNEKRLIFPSIPYKGIEALPDLFMKICEKLRDDELELHIFSSMSLYGEDRARDDQEYGEAFSKLQRMPGVFLHKPVSMKELAVEFMKSSCFIHPSTYHETFGMNIIQSQASGCIPITVNNGAVREIIKDKETGFVTKGRNVWNEKTFNELVDLVCNFLKLNKESKYSLRLKAQNSAKKYHYLEIANRFTQEVTDAINSGSNQKRTTICSVC